MRILPLVLLLALLATTTGCTIQPIVIKPFCISGICSGTNSDIAYVLSLTSDGFLASNDRTGHAPLTVQAKLSGPQPVDNAPVLVDWGDASNSYGKVNEDISHIYRATGNWKIMATLHDMSYTTEVVVIPEEPYQQSGWYAKADGALCSAELRVLDDPGKSQIINGRKNIRIRVDVFPKVPLEIVQLFDQLPYVHAQDSTVYFNWPPSGASLAYTNVLRLSAEGLSGKDGHVLIRCFAPTNMGGQIDDLDLKILF